MATATVLARDERKEMKTCPDCGLSVFTEKELRPCPSRRLIEQLKKIK